MRRPRVGACSDREAGDALAGPSYQWRDVNTVGSGSGRRSLKGYPVRPGVRRPAAVAPAVGTRWFRESGGMGASTRQPLSGRYLSFESERIVCAPELWGVRDRATYVGSDASRRFSRSACNAASSPRRCRTTGPRLRSGHADRRARRRRWPNWLATPEEYVQDRLSGKVRHDRRAGLDGPDTRWIGRRHGRRQDRRWATSWSPEQIADRLQEDRLPDDPMKRCGFLMVRRSTKPCTFKAAGCALRRELCACLRTGRALRVPRARSKDAESALSHQRKS